MKLTQDKSWTYLSGLDHYLLRGTFCYATRRGEGVDCKGSLPVYQERSLLTCS